MSTRPQQPFRISPDATDVDVLAKYFRGFGDPTRLRILTLLGKQERSVGELVEALGQPQPKVSSHLGVLRWCGFVTGQRRGKQVFYRLSDPGVTRVIALTRALGRQSWHAARYNVRRPS